ncbi:MAG: hypothetical protein AB7D37_10860 [Desulfovibrio sp.]
MPTIPTITQTISTLAPAPDPDSPTFEAEAEEYLETSLPNHATELEAFRGQVNASIGGINDAVAGIEATATAVADDASTAGGAAAVATTKADEAVESATAAGTFKTGAEAARDDATAQAVLAGEYAAGLNMPAISASNAGQIPTVNEEGSGYNLKDPAELVSGGPWSAPIDATYLSNASFSIPTGFTSDWPPGVRVKADCGADGLQYGTVASSSYADPTTAVVLTMDDGNALTANLISVLHGNDNKLSLVNHGHTGPADGGLLSLGASKWTPLAGTDYTATPASTSTLTMLTDQTSNIFPGMPLRYTISGTAYYGICTAITPSLLTVAGAPLSGDVTALDYSTSPGMVETIQLMIPGYWADTADTSLILNDLVQPLLWPGAPARLVRIQAYTRTTDTGASFPRINARIGATTTDRICTSNSTAGLQISASATWYTSVVDIDPTKYTVSTGNIIELTTDANGGNDNASDIVVVLRFVYS